MAEALHPTPQLNRISAGGRGAANVKCRLIEWVACCGGEWSVGGCCRRVSAAEEQQIIFYVRDVRSLLVRGSNPDAAIFWYLLNGVF